LIGLWIDDGLNLEFLAKIPNEWQKQASFMDQQINPAATRQSEQTINMELQKIESYIALAEAPVRGDNYDIESRGMNLERGAHDEPGEENFCADTSSTREVIGNLDSSDRALILGMFMCMLFSAFLVFVVLEWRHPLIAQKFGVE
jgi:hypothetical protein